MSLRQIIAIVLIAFANIFILAHAVVPHYHHDGIVCLDATKDDCTSCQHNEGNADCCKNEGKHHSHLEDCNLQQVVERSGTALDDTDNSSINISKTLLVCFCSLHCSTYAIEQSNNLIQDSRYKPYLKSFYTSYLGSVFGLRAPPANII